MSDAAVRVRSGWIGRQPSPEFVGAMANGAAAAEIAVRVAAGAVGVEAFTGLVREYPVVSLLVASGVGYLLGNRWRSRHRAASTQPETGRSGRFG